MKNCESRKGITKRNLETNNDAQQVSVKVLQRVDRLALRSSLLHSFLWWWLFDCWCSLTMVDQSIGEMGIYQWWLQCTNGHLLVWLICKSLQWWLAGILTYLSGCSYSPRDASFTTSLLAKHVKKELFFLILLPAKYSFFPLFTKRYICWWKIYRQEVRSSDRII